ncbi:hypothetical protein DMC25_23070 [Caulobacter sp. D4A]|uniref:hypothetical protein n=1 Tax=unclassified Caulobacter TaxID=2648921 RepID=UPI000D738926|nr:MULTISPECIES: hypothetical protein [unclassified Caulobacter]PXA77562.1 hypothetical protein DMC25_23070 [Caulobacter sp. D4A]PXA96169.1 hypothetical protein DMC18_02260 [Caulobacter sp. D5]
MTSVALHAVLLLAIFGRPGGELAAAGGGEAEGPVEPYVAVELSGRAGAEQPDPAQTHAAQVAQLLARLRQADPAIAIPLSQDQSRVSARSLLDAVEAARAERSHGDAEGVGEGKVERDDGGQGAGRNRDGQVAQPSAGPRSSAPTSGKGAGAGGLFGFVEPCWKKLPGRSGVAVRLEVILDAGGQIASPPKILRPDNARPSDARLIAEARAIAALTNCLPYTGAGRLSGRPQIVDFPTL